MACTKTLTLVAIAGGPNLTKAKGVKTNTTAINNKLKKAIFKNLITIPGAI
jgi:hypothetical protein